MTIEGVDKERDGKKYDVALEKGFLRQIEDSMRMAFRSDMGRRLQRNAFRHSQAQGSRKAGKKRSRAQGSGEQGDSLSEELSKEGYSTDNDGDYFTGHGDEDEELSNEEGL